MDPECMSHTFFESIELELCPMNENTVFQLGYKFEQMRGKGFDKPMSILSYKKAKYFKIKFEQWSSLIGTKTYFLTHQIESCEKKNI